MNIGTEQILYLGEMEKLSLHPDDILVLTLPGHVDEKTVDHLRALFKDVTSNKVLVLEEGMKLGVLECAPSA